MRKSLEQRQICMRGCGGMADAQDSKSCGGDLVWVQVPPSASKKRYLRRMSEVSFFVSDESLVPRVQGLRSATVGTGQTSTGRFMPHHPHRNTSDKSQGYFLCKENGRNGRLNKFSNLIKVCICVIMRIDF